MSLREGPFVKIKSQKSEIQAFTEFKYLVKTNYTVWCLYMCVCVCVCVCVCLSRCLKEELLQINWLWTVSSYTKE